MDHQWQNILLFDKIVGYHCIGCNEYLKLASYSWRYYEQHPFEFEKFYKNSFGLECRGKMYFLGREIHLHRHYNDNRKVHGIVTIGKKDFIGTIDNAADLCRNAMEEKIVDGIWKHLYFNGFGDYHDSKYRTRIARLIFQQLKTKWLLNTHI